MNETWALAFVIAPIAVVAIGYLAVLWHEHHASNDTHGPRHSH